LTLLCADIGNSHTVLGLVDDGEVLDHWRVATDERRTADEWAVLLKGLLRESTVSEHLRGIAVCATVHSSRRIRSSPGRESVRPYPSAIIHSSTAGCSARTLSRSLR